MTKKLEVLKLKMAKCLIIPSEAESFESIKQYKGHELRIEIKNLTIYENGKTRSVKTIWPLRFRLDKSAISERETVETIKSLILKMKDTKLKR
jgi:hypothetical protein